MKSLYAWIVLKLFYFIPLTRFYTLKNRLLRLAGVDASLSARIVSSVEIVGNGHLKIGDDTFIGHGVFISCSFPGITIGSSVDIAPKVIIVNGTHDIDMVAAHTAGAGHCLSIVIENGVWVGAGCIILPGVKIGEKSMIAAGSIVNKDIPPYSIAAGVPCRVIKIWDKVANEFFIPN